MSDTVVPPVVPPSAGETPDLPEAPAASGPDEARAKRSGRRERPAHDVGALADAKVREALWTLISASRKSRTEIDRLLEARRGTTAEILEGKLGLKFGVLIRLLAALEIEPATFFASLFGPPTRTAHGKPLRLEIADRITSGSLDSAAVEPRPTTELSTIRIDIDTAGLRALVEHKVTDAIQEVLAQIARGRSGGEPPAPKPTPAAPAPEEVEPFEDPR